MTARPMTAVDRMLLAERFGRSVPEHHNGLTAGWADRGIDLLRAWEYDHEQAEAS